ncbi:MAG: hypothetical protein JEY94_02075 [Melioribacteraceae bacterium]|nr:hypothetical protein [Melioribacteraceae bacterium]
MNESLIFAELLKNISNDEYHSLLEVIRLKKIDIIREMLVAFMKKYRSNIMHLL